MISRIYRILLGEEDIPTSERSVFYNEAHLSIVTDNKSIVEVAIEIQKSLA